MIFFFYHRAELYSPEKRRLFSSLGFRNFWVKIVEVLTHFMRQLVRWCMRACHKCLKIKTMLGFRFFSFKLNFVEKVVCVVQTSSTFFTYVYVGIIRIEENIIAIVLIVYIDTVISTC